MASKKKVYLETTFVSYLTARPTRDLIRAARQEITREWWDARRKDFDLYVSQLVVDEAREGDRNAAEQRVALLTTLPLLEVNDAATELARMLLKRRCIPPAAVRDSLHVAVAAAHGVDFLLTWNCSHLANAERLGSIRNTIESCGYTSPLICTPEEFLGDWT